MVELDSFEGLSKNFPKESILFSQAPFRYSEIRPISVSDFYELSSAQEQFSIYTVPQGYVLLLTGLQCVHEQSSTGNSQFYIKTGEGLFILNSFVDDPFTIPISREFKPFFPVLSGDITLFGERTAPGASLFTYTLNGILVKANEIDVYQELLRRL